MDGALLPGSASSSESHVSAARNLPDDDDDNRWFFSREEIEKNSPSRRDGIDLAKETELRKSYCAFLQALGERFELDQITIGTAIVLCHRFFQRQSHAKNDRWTIATICMLIAGKVEEPQLCTEDCIAESYEIRNRTKLETAQRKEVYEHQKELVFCGEKLVLATLNFDFYVYHPYELISKAIKKLSVGDAISELSQIIWNFIRNCLQTTLYLQYKHHHIAAAALFLSAHHLKLNIPYESFFPQEFDVTLSQINDIHDQMREFFGESSDDEDAVHQPVSTDMASTDICSSSNSEGCSMKVNLSQSDDHSVHGGFRPEGIGEKNLESGDGNDDSWPSMSEETSDDAGVSQLKKDSQLHEEEVKAEPENEESFD